MAKLSQFSFNNSNQSSKETKSQSFTQTEIQDKFNTYKDMSKEELNAQLFKEVARQKHAGTFDYEGLERMVESLRGSLAPNEYENIKRLLESLK